MLNFVRQRNTLTSSNEVSNIFEPIRGVCNKNDLQSNGCLKFTEETVLKNRISAIKSKSSDDFVTCRHGSSTGYIGDLPKTDVFLQTHNNECYIDIKTLCNNIKKDNLLYFVNGKTFQVNDTIYPIGSLFRIIEEKNTRLSFKIKNRKSGLYVSDCRIKEKFYIPLSTRGGFKRCDEPI